MSEREQVRDNILEITFFMTGSLIIAFFSGVGMTYAFQYNFIGVLVSFLGFISGYKFAQIGYHNGKDTPKEILKDLKNLNHSKTHLLFFGIGSSLLSLGFVFVGRAAFELSLFYAAGSGLLIGGGYLFSHWAVNDSMI